MRSYRGTPGPPARLLPGRCRAERQGRRPPERSRARTLYGSNGGEVSERQTARLEPFGVRRHVLLNSSVVAGVRVMYNPAKRWVKQNVVNCWLGEQGERALFLRRAAAGGCAGA